MPDAFGGNPSVSDHISEADVLAAHAAGDAAALSRLYRAAGLRAEALGDTAHACFLVTMAYVNALDAGLAATASEMQLWLIERGHEKPDDATVTGPSGR